MSVSFYYDTLARVNKFNACYACEIGNTKLRDLPDDLYDKVQKAQTDAVLNNTDSEENRYYLGLIAKDNCSMCDGKGWLYKDELPETINFANANAAAILTLMGYSGDQLYHHSVPISEFKRRLIYANNRDKSRVERSDYIEHGKPREISPGVIEMKPVRVMSKGLSVDDIQERLDRLFAFVKEAEDNNATEIYWS
jgi:hypothetical protein